MKAAGIDFELKRKKKKVMNYNIEIPFKRTVPDGGWDVSSETHQDVGNFRSNIAISQVEGVRRDEQESSKRKVDKKKLQKLKEKNYPKAMDLIHKMNDDNSLVLSHKLEMPSP